MLLKKLFHFCMKTLQRKQKRKLQSVLVYCFISLGIACFVFAGCFGVYYWKVHHQIILNPLALAQQKFANDNTSALHESISKALSDNHIQYTSVTVNEDGTATIALQNNATVIITTHKDILQQIASLQLTIANLTIEGKQLKRMDFRFDKPVVVF